MPKKLKEGLFFSGNECVAMMHRNNAFSFRAVAEFAERLCLTGDEVIELLRENADEVEAQSIVVDLRDQMKIK